jgi:hypothetical protein
MNESIYDNMTRCEKEVADLLREMGIKWRYEQPVFVWDENKRPRVWAPDFYLIPFGVYIEVCGSSNFDYEYRRKILDKNGIRVVFLHLFKNKDKWKYHLMNYLERIMYQRYKKLNEILRYEN